MWEALVYSFLFTSNFFIMKTLTANHHPTTPNFVIVSFTNSFTKLKYLNLSYRTVIWRPAISRIMCLATIVAFSYCIIVAQDFDNPGFETSSSCSATNCTHEDVSCIDDWWNWTSTMSVDEDEAWVSYDCNSYDVCGDERGMFIGDVTGGSINPTTDNPVFGDETLDKYMINLDLFPLTPDPSTNPGVYLIVRGSYLANSTSFSNADLLGYVEITGEEFTCNAMSVYVNYALNGDKIMSPSIHISFFPCSSVLQCSQRLQVHLRTRLSTTSRCARHMT